MTSDNIQFLFKSPEQVKQCKMRYCEIEERNLPLEKKLMKRMPEIRKRSGHMTLCDLGKIAKWKANNRVSWQDNKPGEVKEISKISFAPNQAEHIRIKALLCLHGVDWPMASAILHLAFLSPAIKDSYPIFDVRVMAVIGESTSCSLRKWLAFIQFSREAAKHYEVSMRTLDRALWVRGKEIMEQNRGRKNG